MVLPGIINSNEFYSDHYLESVIKEDIKKVNKRWIEEAISEKEGNSLSDVITPNQRFKGLRKLWQKLREAERGIKNNPGERLSLQRELFFKPLSEALGYDFDVKTEPVLVGGEAFQIPLIGEVKNNKGEPYLWLVECFNPNDENCDPLELHIANNWDCQINDPSLGYVFDNETWDKLIGDRIFGQDIPPRWVIVISRDQLLLIDRQKWPASRMLRFDLDVLFGEYNPDALLAATTLLHKEHTCPSDGAIPYLDYLDENSHKHAFEVSDDLKYALRKSIELIGNEAIYWRKENNKGVFKGKTDADQLTLECLRYMYRLLFLFYVESRPELGYAPMQSDIYRLGYSLESLRDMDKIELLSEEDKESFYISDSLDRLFQIIWEGFPKRDDPNKQILLDEDGETFHATFRITPLRAHLFDPDRLPCLTRVRFRNVVMREVIELMSLTREIRGKRRGRVSYSQLGINQLGAVYESLLSFRGFFSEEELFEVKPAPKKGKKSVINFESSDKEIDDLKNGGSTNNDLEVGHFVTREQLKSYKSEEIVLDDHNGNPKCYPKGSFIYRLAGRDREKSASYYTPESLTRCLVKYSLKDLLNDKSASDILDLKICEPAMGSAAFLNEVVNQLAQTYIEVRQRETGKRIPQEEISTELQKIKMRLADQNVFGVDLNPIAIELAEVSLWLNSIFTPEKGRAFVPWFSQQLLCGNSLIGARRQIYRIHQLRTSLNYRSKPKKIWYENPPEELAWNCKLPEDAIFHFLLPDPDMATYKDKVIKNLEPDAIKNFKKWNKAFVGDIFTEAQIDHLLRLSKLVDNLWRDWVVQQKQIRDRTTDSLPVWEDPGGIIDSDWTSLKLKDRIQDQEIYGYDVENANARLRLKWAMDYWTSLWFWPVSESESLPSRDEWLLHLSMILGDLEQGIGPEIGQGNLFADTQPKQFAIDFMDRCGFVDVQKLKKEFYQLQVVEAIINRIRPLHWDLEYADLLESGGFDLIVGNPPWLRVRWEEKGIIGEADPMVLIRKFRASELAKRRDEAFAGNPHLISSYKTEYEYQSGTQSFLNAITNYGLLKGSSANLYKNFLPLSWRISAKDGIQGFLHPESVYDDQKGLLLRKEIYTRLRNHFQFQNALFLFPEVHDQVKFSINQYGQKKAPYFNHIANLFHAKTVDETINHSGEGLVYGIKDQKNQWNINGHRERLIQINNELLTIFSKLFDNPGTPALEARLPSVHSKKIQDVLKKISAIPFRLRDFEGQYLALEMWNETSAQKDGTIRRETCFPSEEVDLILSGPHLFEARPFNKTPRSVCTNSSQYDCIDLNQIPNNYLPRTNYKTNISKSEYLERVPRVPWGEKSPVTDFYRVCYRKMLGQPNERTLVSSLFPPGVGHVNSIISIVFKELNQTLDISTLLSSICADFFVKCTGKSNLYSGDLANFPYSPSLSCPASKLRTMALNCLTDNYAYLWDNCWNNLFRDLCWSKDDLRLDNNFFKNLTSKWNRHCALRSDYARRQALLENDVIVAQSLGLTLEDLINIYRIQFPVMQEYERDTWFDRKGRIVFTSNKGLTGIGFSRNLSSKSFSKNLDWDEIAKMPSGSVELVIVDDTIPGGPVERKISFEAPFDRCDRVEDYKVAWEFFENKNKS